jgi:signal transduction histidine kinase
VTLSGASSAQTFSGKVVSSNQVARQVTPQNNVYSAATILSNTIPEESDFRKLIGDDTSGALARFLDNKLRLMVWYRPSTTSDFVFGAQLNQAQLLERLRSVLQAPEYQERPGASMISRSPAATVPSYCVALLDDTGQPVALSIPGFTADWKHPFVATEIGETLPHWEAALYLTNPGQMSKSAHTLQITIGLVVLLLVVAIVAGGSLIAADIRRQIRQAQQKTDFVSNVSHELKTPLTSIRMFADLLSDGRVAEPERQLTYLKIISAESARLTRLINNVLDFARQERGAPAGKRSACDMVEATRDVVETCLPHLEANGQNLTCEIEAETLPILGDRDALAQIVLNLISNAEKYGGGEILVRLRRQETATGPIGCVDFLDRGPGIPPKQVESIFLPFRRLHDSLSSGIPGSGLGLTLARRMARAHRGDITYTPRAGGGSCFTLTIPLTS